MREIAKNVWQLSGFPRDMFNVYLAGDILIDAGTRWAKRRIFRQLAGRTLSMVALTHCHPDHQGAVRAVCQRFGVPLAVHQADAAAMEGRQPMVPANWLVRLGERFWSGPPYPVSRVLQDGDVVGEFRVVHAPGHTPGHVMYFREADRLVIAGDVLANIHFFTCRPGLREPPPFFSADRRMNWKAIRKLADLRPSMVCFGHGPPLERTEVLLRVADRVESFQVEAAMAASVG
jgi:glyoxylase-like metal-dependent hydrolase (beta-lactamase superfamily II)